MNKETKKDVFDTLSRINKVINNSPLIQKLSHLVEIDCSVVGGAIRDLYLDKDIKDIDISIHLNFSKNLKIKKENFKNYTDDYTYDMILQTNEAQALEYRNNEVLDLLGTSDFNIIHDYLLKSEKKPTTIQAIVFLIQKILEDNNDYSINKIFNNDIMDVSENVEIRDKAYINIGLCAVMAISNKNTKYPIELLFTTDTSNIFIQSFDFNICKIYMKDNNGKPLIVPSSEFLKDVEQNIITYTPITNITEAKMNKSLFVRYERLQKKFPEYVLTSSIEFLSKENKEMVHNTVKAVSLFHQVNEKTKFNLNEKTVKNIQKI